MHNENVLCFNSTANANDTKNGIDMNECKTQDSCVVMFGKVKLGEADYTGVWETLLFMSNILCQTPWKGPFEA